MGELREEVSELRCVLLNKVIRGGGRGRFPEGPDFLEAKKVTRSDGRF